MAQIKQLKDTSGNFYPVTHKDAIVGIEDIQVDMTGYATELWVEELNYLKEHQDISDKVDVSAFEEAAEVISATLNLFHSNTLWQTEDTYVKCDKSKTLEEAISGEADIVYFTTDSHQIVLNGSVYNVLDLTGYATEQWVTDKGYLTEIPNYYITETELDAKGYLTEHIDISNKVDKVEGKGLSTNDYTTEEKNKLAGIAAGAEVNVQSDWNITDTSSDAFIKNKPTKLSDFTNDSGFITGVSWGEVTGKPTFATVATSGSYNDLSNKPTIPTVPSYLPNQYSLKFGNKSYNGSSEQTITAADLGLSQALKYHGVSETALTDGSTTNPITILGLSHTAESGCVVFYNNKEFVWNGSVWEELGDLFGTDFTGYASSLKMYSGTVAPNDMPATEFSMLHNYLEKTLWSGQVPENQYGRVLLFGGNGYLTGQLYWTNVVVDNTSSTGNLYWRVGDPGRSADHSTYWAKTQWKQIAFTDSSVAISAPAFYETSDARKKDIKSDLSLDKCYDLIDKCQTVIYSLKDQTKEQVGMIAQEIEEFFPEVVATDEAGFKSLAYDRLVVICFKVLKDVIKRLEKLENHG